MSIAKELVDFLVGAGLATAAKMHPSQIPATNLEQTDMWSVVAQGVSISGGNILQWKRTQRLLVTHRHNDGEALYNADDALRAAIGDCLALPSYKVIRATVNPMTEQEMTGQKLHVATWLVELQIISKESES